MAKKKKGGKAKKKSNGQRPAASVDETVNATGATEKTTQNGVDKIEHAVTDAPAEIPNHSASKPVEDSPKEVVTKNVIPDGLAASLSLFTPKQQILAKLLCSPILKQSHLFENWSTSSDDDDLKRTFVQQLESLDKSYPAGGIVGYISNAKDLLEKSKKGVNPLEGWKPCIPTGQAFEIGTEEYDEVEAIGIKELGSVGFVLVAGGLGERLGYSDIKIGLPTEMATGTKYLQFYIEYILALQKKYAPEGRKLPLCIMTSGDTNASTLKLLKDNKYFGMEEGQITIVQQGEGVPAVLDNNARIALHSQYKILTKPHGHGDIHALLYSHNVAKSWVEQGIGWIAFFQDTNGLAFHTLPLALGVSTKFDLIMNSLAVPRKAKQEIGAITKLVNAKDQSRTINVEYNQLDPLLRATGYPDGDVNDETTGLSPFPGNINQLLFKLQPYADTLDRTKGAMPEFVNPKYKDAEKTVFKKPTRLECMMQDFPTVLQGEDSEKVGFTSIAAELCFSPVKNASADGVGLQLKGTHPGVAASGEADQYGAVRKILRSIGVKIDDAATLTFNGINVIPGPQIVLKPDFASCPAEYKTAFPTPKNVKISPRSSLVVKGSGLVIESLTLDGALVIECEEGATGVIRDLVVENEGWRLVPDETPTSEIISMRGYTIEKKETRTIIFKNDGSIEGNYDPDAKAKLAVEKRVPLEPETTDEPVLDLASTNIPEMTEKLSPPSPVPSHLAIEPTVNVEIPDPDLTPVALAIPEMTEVAPTPVLAHSTIEPKVDEGIPAPDVAAPADPILEGNESLPTSASVSSPVPTASEPTVITPVVALESGKVDRTIESKGAVSLTQPAPEEAEQSKNDCGCTIL